jgi:hypothetical protein
VIALALLILLFLAAGKPDTFRVARSERMRADPGRIFANIDDFHNWQAWSPYEKLDANMSKTFSGSASGKGAVYEWNGNKDVGTGRMQILESSSPAKIVIKLDFLKPFEGHNTAEFTLTPQGDATEVTWAVFGPAGFMMKVMQIFVNMDHMMGKDFAAGLANLKALVER